MEDIGNTWPNMSVEPFEEAIKDQKVPIGNLRSWYSWKNYSILAKKG